MEETTQDILSFASGVKAIGVVGDVCSRADQERMVKESDRCPHLQCRDQYFYTFPYDPDEWWKQMEIMVKSPTELTRMILPTMRKHNSGTIIYTILSSGRSRSSMGRRNELNNLQKDTFGHEANGISVLSIHPGEVKTKLHETAFPQKTKDEAPYVVEHMAKMAKIHPDFKAKLAAWTCVYLSAGNGAGLQGRLVDCTRDVGEVKKQVMATPRPRITNACG